MNIFCTNECPIQSAREHCNVHVVKMILEYSQLLSTAHRITDGDSYADQAGLYKATHKNHPSAVYARKSTQHYRWVWECLNEIHSIYEAKSGKVHKGKRILDALSVFPLEMSDEGFELPTLAMPDQYKSHAVFGGRTKAYQMYLNDKFVEWKSRDKPMKVEWHYGRPIWVH